MEKMQLKLFDIPPLTKHEQPFKRIQYPVWTERKAKLIQRYLYYFVLITKHGTYIDGFAGPQKADEPDMWAAKLVIENEPRWLRNFYLFDDNLDQYECLLSLKESQPHDPKKQLFVFWTSGLLNAIGQL
jgi:three-Cys-motif partner protein